MDKTHAHTFEVFGRKRLVSKQYKEIECEVNRKCLTIVVHDNDCCIKF